MRYFLDSSVIVAAGLAIDPRKLSVFRDQAERDHIGLITSEVVIDEVVHKFREKVELERRQVESAIQKMTKTVSQGFLVRISDDQVNRWCEQYEEFVRSIFENEHPGSGVQGYPTISHEAVAEKARLGKRPY